MKTLEKGKDKIQKICAVLRDETLGPAQKQAQEILDQARQEAEKIVADARKEAENLHAAAKAAIEKERNVFQSSLQQAAKQALETLQQKIENRFFTQNLTELIQKEASDPHLVAGLINAIIKALEKEGLAANLTILVPKDIAPRQINELLLGEFLKEIQDQSVATGQFLAGAQIRLNDKNLTIDMSENALRDLLANYVVRKDFRKLIFES